VVSDSDSDSILCIIQLVKDSDLECAAKTAATVFKKVYDPQKKSILMKLNFNLKAQAYGDTGTFERYLILETGSIKCQEYPFKYAESLWKFLKLFMGWKMQNMF
jgi:hypothetical protein